MSRPEPVPPVDLLLAAERSTAPASDDDSSFRVPCVGSPPGRSPSSSNSNPAASAVEGAPPRNPRRSGIKAAAASRQRAAAVAAALPATLRPAVRAAGARRAVAAAYSNTGHWERATAGRRGRQCRRAGVGSGRKVWRVSQEAPRPSEAPPPLCGDNAPRRLLDGRKKR
eukprot:366195-Chlamydomonas_euryale.AAC.5